MAKRGRKKKKQVNKVNQNVVVAVMIIASILLTILIYTESGTVGKALGPFLGGIMGYIKYILPIGVFVMALYIAYQGENTWSKKILQFSMILLCISIIINVVAIANGDVTIAGRDFKNIINIVKSFISSSSFIVISSIYYSYPSLLSSFFSIA